MGGGGGGGGGDRQTETKRKKGKEGGRKRERDGEKVKKIEKRNNTNIYNDSNDYYSIENSVAVCCSLLINRTDQRGKKFMHTRLMFLFSCTLGLTFFSSFFEFLDFLHIV